MAKPASHIIATTFNIDAHSVTEYRYQRYANPAVYAIGDRYFAVCSRKPNHAVGGEWVAHNDQFFAEPAGTTLWVCNAGVAA